MKKSVSRAFSRSRVLARCDSCVRSFVRPSVPRRTDGRTELAREALENAETRVQRQTVSEVKSALKTYDE